MYPIESAKHREGTFFVSPEIASILAAVEAELGDHALAQSTYFSPTALTHVKRLINQGGTIITDTTLAAHEINKKLLGSNGATVQCFIESPRVSVLASQKKVTKAEIAVDYALGIPGLKLLVVGSAPSAINRVLVRRQLEPMSDVCVLAAPNGFASVVQLKERLKDSNIASIIIRGKKGGILTATALLNAILHEIAK